MEELIKSIRDRNAILFAGSGLSAGLGLPTFSQLIDFLANELSYDPQIFSTFGSFWELAEFYKNAKGSIGQLRSWLDREWHSDKIDITKSEPHNLILELDFPLIYTTNYDRWIEYAHRDAGKEFRKVVNVGDLINLPDSKTQIVKFHGDFDDDNSIVLTESSYFDRLNFESPLDIKLRSDALGKSILFIGYSLNDINMRLLLYKLHLMWLASPNSSIRPKCYVFMAKPNPVQEDIFEKRGVKSIVSNSDNPGEALIEFLRRLVKNAKGKV
ncbi:SIR2 family protein [Chitinispirillales bacterium ANBcel5]|uniref:SIR2 family protein n=1 Tax=Cellulosispirillum alkaliphilum TaxID=3039283 RepID=UPI002A4EBAFE|nr:SIR2 family protein [Chitinispirillales bacterium ANBcel5]